MNQCQIEAMKESAIFLHENHIPRMFLWELLDESFKAHKWMGEGLGLKEENNYRTIIPIPEDCEGTDLFSLFVNRICKIKKETTREAWTVMDKSFIQDGKKNKYKVTRLLDIELWKELAKWEEGMELARISGLVSCCLDCSLKNDSDAKEFMGSFARWYGEQTKSGWQIVLSCHPLDILRASHNSAFQSCYRPQGEYFNGVLASMLSSDTLISSVEEIKKPGYKIGRSWVYANRDIIIIGRKYGSMLDSHHFLIRNYLYGKMGGKWTHKPTLRIGDGDELISLQGPGYLDRNFGDVTIRKEMALKVSDVKKIVIPRAICLFCGTRYDNCNSRGVCRDCLNAVSNEEFAE